MRTARLHLAFFLLSGAFSPAFAAASSSADVEHLHVQLIIPQTTLIKGQTAPAGLYFKLEQGWHVYWKNAGDSGEPPHIKWTLPQGISATSLQFPAPQRLPLGPLMDFGYEDEVLFPLTFSASPAANAGTATLHAHVDWLVCREVCIPGKADLEANRSVAEPGGQVVSVQPDAGIYARLSGRLPAAAPATWKAGFVSAGDGLRLIVETGQRESQAIFFPADQDILDNPAPQKFTAKINGFSLDLKKDANLAQAPKQLNGVIELSGGRAYEIVAPQGAPTAVKVNEATARIASPEAASGSSSASSISTNSGSPASSAPIHPGILRIIGLAFLGGLVLNLMPCVFPVLFLKGLALVNSGSEERHSLRAHGLVYTAGIVASFWALVGVLLAIRAAGSRLGWGFQFQSPIFLFLMAGLLFFVGLSLAGQFEIGLTLTSAGGSLAAKQGYAGSFFTGVLAVVVATPCTAPFMGAAIGYALSASAVVTFAVFTALALGLAAPYLLLTLQPAWTRILPRPGAWMEVLRQAVSIPIFGTVIWLAWVIANTYGAEMLAALLVGLLMLAIAGWFLGRWPGKKWAVIVSGVIVLVTAGLGALSGRSADRAGIRFDPSRVLAIPLKSGSYWNNWTQEKQAQYLAQGTPVFVDFTAKWCLSCQVNERIALTRPEVMQTFADAHVALMKADWTQHDDDIARELERLGRSGVPVYALYVPGEAQPRLLPEALTPGIVIDALKDLPKTATETTAATSNPK